MPAPARRYRSTASRLPAPRLPIEAPMGNHFIDAAMCAAVSADAHYTGCMRHPSEGCARWSISQAEAQLDPGLFPPGAPRHIVAIPHVTSSARRVKAPSSSSDGPSAHRVPVSRADREVKARLGRQAARLGFEGLRPICRRNDRSHLARLRGEVEIRATLEFRVRGSPRTRCLWKQPSHSRCFASAFFS